jgi:hypothetical protein
MSREVERIFGEFGVEVTWKDGSQVAYGDGTFADPLSFNVVLLPSNAASRGYKKRALAVGTYREGWKGSVYIFYPEVEKTLFQDTGIKELSTHRFESYIARALGRIVAHEVVHVLAPSYPHTSTGLMASGLTRRFLLLNRSGIHMDPESARVVRSGILSRMSSVNVASRKAKKAEKRIVKR